MLFAFVLNLRKWKIKSLICLEFKRSAGDSPHFLKFAGSPRFSMRKIGGYSFKKMMEYRNLKAVSVKDSKQSIIAQI